MRALLSTVGSRGEVEPMVALASALQEQGDEAVICGPPDFADLVGSAGIPFAPVGPSVRGTARPATATVPTPEQRQQAIEGTVAAQFAAVGAAVDGCDVVVACGALAIAARSVAEQQGIPSIYAAFCPVTLPSPHHAPPLYGSLGESAPPPDADRIALWAEDARRWNERWGAALNAHRQAAGLPPVTDVRSHLFTDRPWLAADPFLAPWPDAADDRVIPVGAWMRRDRRPLPAEVEAFLAAGAPPVYVGFGSMRAPRDAAATAIGAARAAGLRVLVSGGWAGLAPVDDGDDCLAVGEVDHGSLFGRCAAVVHHGGAGTTTTAAAAGVPQVVVPRMYDQFWFADRVEWLGIGAAAVVDELDRDVLTSALRRVRQADVVQRAAEAARSVRTDGATAAARRLVTVADGVAAE